MDNFDGHDSWDFGGLDFDNLVVGGQAVLYVVVVVVADCIADIVDNVVRAVPPILVAVDVLLVPDDVLYFFQFDDKLHICGK